MARLEKKRDGETARLTLLTILETRRPIGRFFIGRCMTIYFIRAGDSGNIKIGYTAAASAEKRMRQLQTGNIFDLELLGTIPGEMCDEKSMHSELKEYALRGEWFRPDPGLVFLIGEIIKHQHPWYFIRQMRLRFERMETEWAAAHSLVKNLEQSAFEVPICQSAREYISSWKAMRRQKIREGRRTEEVSKPWYMKRIEEETRSLRAAESAAIAAEARAGISPDQIQEDAAPSRGGPWYMQRINELTNKRREFLRREESAKDSIYATPAAA